MEDWSSDATSNKYLMKITTRRKLLLRKIVTKTIPLTTSILTRINPLHLSLRDISTVEEEKKEKEPNKKDYLPSIQVFTADREEETHKVDEFHMTGSFMNMEYQDLDLFRMIMRSTTSWIISMVQSL